MRLLRSGLPQPQHHRHPAAADRAAPEMARQPEGPPLLARLQDEYEYDGIETCAVDGSCAIRARSASTPARWKRVSAVPNQPPAGRRPRC